MLPIRVYHRYHVRNHRDGPPVLTEGTRVLGMYAIMMLTYYLKIQ